MLYKIFVFTILIILSLSGCSGAGSGGASGTDSGLSNSGPAAEAAIIKDTEEGLIAGLNLNDNIEEDESITSNGDISWIEGLAGKALSLDEDGEFISLPDSNDLDLLGGGTVSVWVRPTEHISFAGILHKGVEKDFSDEAWSLQYWSGYKPAIFIYNGSGVSKRITSDSALELNKWHHLTAAWGFDSSDGKSWFRLYINGLNKGEIDISTFLPLKDSDGDLIIGSQLPVSHSAKYGHVTFRGAIDNILIYDHLLSEEEILELYNEYSDL